MGQFACKGQRRAISVPRVPPRLALERHGLPWSRRDGATLDGVYVGRPAYPSDGTVNLRRPVMTSQVDTEDLIDATEVATLLGLSQRNSVSLYQRRYAAMPRPIVERGRGRIKLWSRKAVIAWQEGRGDAGAPADVD